MRKKTAVLFFILLAAALLRIWGVGFGLPDPECRSDETEIVFRAVRMATGDLNPHYYVYPAFYMYLNFGLYLIYFFFLYLTGEAAALGALLHRYFFDPSPYLLIARTGTAVLGTATVYIVYRMGRKIGGGIAGLSAAALLAFCYLHGRDSHFAVTDVPSTFFIAFSLYYIIDMYREKRMRFYVLAGLTAGLATAVKYNAAILLVPILLAHFLKPGSRMRYLSSLTDRKIWAAFAVFFLTFLAAAPYSLLDFSTFIHDFFWQMQRTSSGWVIDTGPGYIYHAKITFRYGLGIVWAILMPCAVIFALFHRDKRLFILGAFTAVHLLVIGRSSLVFARYGIPILPALAVMTAVLMLKTIDRIPFLARRRHGAVLLFLLAALMEPAYYLVMNDVILSRDDTRLLCKHWVEKNLPNNAFVLISGGNLGMPFLHRSPYTLEHLEQRIREPKRHDAPARIYSTNYYELARAAPGYPPEPHYTLFFSRGLKMARIQARGIQYVITIESLLKWYAHAGEDFKRTLHENAVLLKVFDPYPPDRRPAVYDMADGYFGPYGPPGNMIRPGPLIKVYRCPGVKDSPEFSQDAF